MSELLKIDVNAHTEKKGQLTYLSWAWAWAEVLKLDPQATWEVVEQLNGLPIVVLPDDSAMVKVVVTINNHAKSCWLPVMDNKNKAIKGPDAFQINTAIMRCMTKAVSMHGLGLYIYAGEDLPEGAERPTKTPGVAADFSASGPKLIFESLTEDWQAYLRDQSVIVNNLFDQFGASRALDAITALELGNDERAGLEYLLSSKCRSSIKREPAKETA